MSTPSASASIATPGSHSSPTSNVHPSPQIQATNHIRREVACIFVVEGTARMQPHLDIILNAYAEPILRQLRSTIVTDGDERHPKTKITPFLKYGMVVYGDYEPGSMVTIDRKYFTSDLPMFLNVFRSIPCKDGGIVRNAANEGLVAALEMFDEYKTELDGSASDPMLHCILISNSLPHVIGTRKNLDDKYNNFTLEKITQEMRKNGIRLSLITPSKGYTEYERIVNEVNEKKAELHTVSDTILPSHIVRLAGFKLPENPSHTQPSDGKQQVDTSKTVVSGITTPKRPAEGVASPQSVSSTDSVKRRKRDNVPSQINLPKATVDPAKFAQLAKHFGVANAAGQAAAAAVAAAPAASPQVITSAPPTITPQVAVAVATPPQQQQLPPPAPQQQQQQLLLLPQQPTQHISSQPPQQPPVQISQQQPPPQMQQPPLQQQPNQVPKVTTTGVPPRPTGTLLQIQQLMQQRKSLMSLPNRSTQQQQQLQAINGALERIVEMRRAEEFQQHQQQQQANAGNNPMAPANMTAARPTATSSPMGFLGAMSTGMQVRPSPVSDASNTPQQIPANLQHGMNITAPPHVQGALASQQRLLLATQLGLQQQKQQQQQQQRSPQPPNMISLSDLSQNATPQMMQAQAPQALQAAAQAQQQQQQQQQQQPTLPVWTGQIVWHIKQLDGTFQEFTCFCGAFAIIRRGTTISREDYCPEMWPQRITIAGRTPSAAATQIISANVAEHKLPYCLFRPLDSSTSQDHHNFNLLIKNLEQKKSFAKAVFSTNSSDPQHGVILTTSAQKLVGILFARVPLPDLNNFSQAPPQQQPQQQQQQQQQNPSMLSGVQGNNMPMNLIGMSIPNNANPNMLGMNGNAAGIQLLRALQQRQQQQQQQAQQTQGQQTPQQQQQQPMVNPGVMMGSPVNAMNGVRPGLTQQSLLVSNLNLAPGMGGNNNLMGMQMNGANLTPQAVRELQQRIFMAQQRHKQQQQQNAQSNDHTQM